MEFDSIRDAAIGMLPGWMRRLGRTILVFEDRENALHEWRRARDGVPEFHRPIHRVLVICYGNICRSPFAAALLARRVPNLEVRSAGLSARDDKPPEPAAQRIARAHGIEIYSHGAHRMRADDVGWADLIIAMEGYQATIVRRTWPDAADKTHLLGDFFGEAPFLITDPYGHEDETFTGVFDLIADGVEALALRLPPGAA
jgi:protein-tyrosine phosphatase